MSLFLATLCVSLLHLPLFMGNGSLITSNVLLFLAWPPAPSEFLKVHPPEWLGECSSRGPHLLFMTLFSLLWMQHIG